MRLTYDFSQLWDQVNRLKGAVESFSVDAGLEIDPIDVSLGGRGIEVKLDELEKVGALLAYQGRQVLLYIPDQGRKIDEVLSGDRDAGKKFHVAHCITLDTMRDKGRFERYFAITNPTGSFPVSGVSYQTGTGKDGEAALYVCINCLKHINYKNSAISKQARRESRENFEITEFFETYSSCFKFFPKRMGKNPGSSNYSPDWKEVSERIRRQANWQCDDCGVKLSDRKDLLHTHHIDGNKANNASSNLRPLCIGCHRDQPMHEYMFTSYEDMAAIIRKRRDQNLIQPIWSSAIKNTDSALRGVLALAKENGWSVPEIAFPLSPTMTVDAAWPDKRIAISLISKTMQVDENWKVLSLSAALAMLNPTT